MHILNNTHFDCSTLLLRVTHSILWELSVLFCTQNTFFRDFLWFLCKCVGFLFLGSSVAALFDTQAAYMYCMYVLVFMFSSVDCNLFAIAFDIQSGVGEMINCGGVLYDLTTEANVKRAFVQIKKIFDAEKFQRIGKSTVNDNNGVNLYHYTYVYIIICAEGSTSLP